MPARAAPKTVILLMGPPGSGKGTQAQALQERYGLERIETGRILREIAKEPSDRGRRVQTFVDSGRLAPPPMVAQLVAEEARRILAGGGGILFDGSPRTLAEAEILSRLLSDITDRVLVIMLDVPKSESVARILKRWICTDCKRPQPPMPDIAEACRLCGGKLEKRADDTTAIVEKRWEEYTFRTLPVIEYFNRQGKVARVNGNRPISDVVSDVAHIVTERLGI
jgi:adenylate kinase